MNCGGRSCGDLTGPKDVMGGRRGPKNYTTGDQQLSRGKLHKILKFFLPEFMQYFFLFFKKTLDKLNRMCYSIITEGNNKQKKRKGDKKMFTVRYFDGGVYDEMVVFTGSLAECEMYVELFRDDGEELYIVEPDGFTVH